MLGLGIKLTDDGRELLDRLETMLSELPVLVWMTFFSTAGSETILATAFCSFSRLPDLRELVGRGATGLA